MILCKAILTLILLVFAPLLRAQCDYVTRQNTNHCLIQWNDASGTPLTREFWLYIPASYPTNGTGTAIIGLHGSQDSGAAYNDFWFDRYADTYGYLAIRPTSTALPAPLLNLWQIPPSDANVVPPINSGGSNWIWESRGIPLPDDPGFVREIVRLIKLNLNPDPNRIWIEGFSLGAVFAASYIGETSGDLFAGAIIHDCGGCFNYVDPSLSGVPGIVAPLNILWIFGDMSLGVPCGHADPLQRPHFSSGSIDQTIDYWTGPKGNNCAVKTPSTTFCTGVDGTLTGLTTKTATSCSNGVEIRWYMIIGAAHQWYNVPFNIPPGTSTQPYNPDLTPLPSGTGLIEDDIIWKFVNTHPKASSGSPTISLSPTTLSYSATVGGPNPANQSFTVTNTGSGTLSWTATKTQTWLTISPTSGGTGQPVTCSISISGLTAGTYTDTVTVSASGATNTPQTVAITLNLTGASPPVFTAAGVVNAASFGAGPVAPGEIITIFGTSLSGSVTFDGTPAILVFASPTQVNVTVPYSVSGPAAVLQMGASSVRLQVAPSAPGIFAATSAGHNIVVLYATGCGALTSDDLPRCALPISVTVNGEPAQVLYAGIAPGLVQGANQINIQLPDDITFGPLTIVLTAGDADSKPFSMTLP